MLCDMNCNNLKCIATGTCAAPEVESPSVVPEYCTQFGPTFCKGYPNRCTKCSEPDAAFDRAAVEAGYAPLRDYVARHPELAGERPKARIIDADSATRKTFPMAAGLLDYFPDALAEVARVSFLGNQKHNPGKPMHHARSKSMDHADCIIRHLVGRGGFDGELRESASLAWRALALLQEELEAEHGLPLPRGARAG